MSRYALTTDRKNYITLHSCQQLISHSAHLAFRLVPDFTAAPRFASRRNTVSARSETISLNAASPEGIPFACSNWNVSCSISSATTGGWTTGFYFVKLTASSGKQSYIIFVLRDDASTSKFLFQSAVANWQAYNSWAGPPVGLGMDGGVWSPGIGKSIYCPDWVAGGEEPTGCGALKVSFNRPYAVMNMGSTGGKSNNLNATSTVGSHEFLAHLNSDRYDTVGGWEYNMVRFLEPSPRQEVG